VRCIRSGTEMFPETFLETQKPTLAQQILALDHTPNEIHGA